MKYILILLLAMGIYACGNKSSKNTEDAIVDSTINKTTDSITHKSDTLNSAWINNFRDFRNALYRDDLSKIKSYFSFPVLNTNNEIWSVVRTDSTDIFAPIGTDTLIPFTENDFSRYYKKLFPKEFKTGILKIKSDELFKSNNSSMEFINNIDSATSSFMSASVNKEEKTLTLILLYDTEILDENGNKEDGGESSIGYIFTIQNDGRLLFKEIRIAG